ncbi:hypothetical protein CFC21_049093 [Triticum aestivum]|uniref:Uncharacterized protein n=3 Tax=Triticinae TaxID=1648030 RepID=A0A453G5A2_AEGTS|nr:uncharacterized protein LOC120975973 [Aegilops tauschii subsp. strangulata]XP_044353722.1 uncharacterized protein LOC123075111 [Triticum aestivum]KAF7039015.1 hypothetical protein CFC21_049093 [Triticum aestivum]
MAFVARAAILARDAAIDPRSVDAKKLSLIADMVGHAAAAAGYDAERLMKASCHLMGCEPEKTPDAADKIGIAAGMLAGGAQQDLLAQAALDLQRAASHFSQAAIKKSNADKVANAASLVRQAASRSPLDATYLSWVADRVAYASARYLIRQEPESLREASQSLASSDPEKRQTAADAVSVAAAHVAQRAEEASTDAAIADKEALVLLAETARELERTVKQFGEAAARDLKGRAWMLLFGWRNKGKEKENEGGGLNEHLLPGPSSSSSTGTPEQPQRQHKDPDLGDYLGYPLFGSLTLLPYLGADGLTKGMSPDDRWWFHVLFSCFWGMVAFGALCKHSQYRVLIWYAWLADRIGMLAITALVVFYSCFIIAPEATRTVKFILGAAAAIHIGSSILEAVSFLLQSRRQ